MKGSSLDTDKKIVNFSRWVLSVSRLDLMVFELISGMICYLYLRVYRLEILGCLMIKKFILLLVFIGAFFVSIIQEIYLGKFASDDISALPYAIGNAIGIMLISYAFSMIPAIFNWMFRRKKSSYSLLIFSIIWFSFLFAKISEFQDKV